MRTPPFKVTLGRVELYDTQELDMAHMLARAIQSGEINPFTHLDYAELDKLKNCAGSFLKIKLSGREVASYTMTETALNNYRAEVRGA